MLLLSVSLCIGFTLKFGKTHKKGEKIRTSRDLVTSSPYTLECFFRKLLTLMKLKFAFFLVFHGVCPPPFLSVPITKKKHFCVSTLTQESRSAFV